MSKESTPRFSKATYLAGVIALTGFLSAIVFSWIGKPLPEAVSPAAIPHFVEIVETEFDSSQDGIISALRLGYSGATVAELAGVVTEVNTAVGQHVTSGDILFWVNQDPVYALQSEVVFFRHLMEGMSGPDVEALQTFLNEEREERITADGKYGAGTTAAVKRWELELGIPQSGTVPAGRFATISGDFEVAVVSLQAGDPAPAARSVPVQEATRYQISSVTGEAGAFAPANYRFRSSGTEFELSHDGNWTASDPEALAQLLSGQLSAAGEELVLPGRLSLAQPVVALSVPASALLGGDSGGVCAWVEGHSQPITDIQILGNAPSGAVTIESSSLTEGTNVMVNPAEVQKKCP